MNGWSIAGISAAAILALVGTYVALRWRKAPAAYHGMIAVAIACFAAGGLAGVAGLHTILQLNGTGRAVKGSPETVPSVVGGRVPAKIVGRALILTDEKHAGDPNWVPSSETAELCDRGAMDTKSLLCRAAYLARHALGKDLGKGPRDEWVSLSEVADLCDAGDLAKNDPLCKEAYSVRNAKMR